MEKRLEDFCRGENLAFASNPFEIRKNSTSKLEQKNNQIIEDYLKLEKPSEIRSIKPCPSFPKSNFSQLIFTPPSERKSFLQQISPTKQIQLEFEKSTEVSKKEENRFLNEDFDSRNFIKLEKWFLIVNTSTEKAALCGFRNDIDEMWSTDSLLARISPNKIITSSNMCYDLVGPIDSNKQKSLIISSSFKDGFPENWKAIIYKHLK